ncbi:MAG TPA: DUF1207 domain-containing protein [Longimicrobiales bacterium]|nr:DUF1207 domain-containing protein [Longimicrobiales bacterium]
MNCKLLVAVLMASANVASAQTQSNQTRSNWDRFLPSVHYFRPLIADVQEPRMALGLMKTDVFKYAGEGRERRFEPIFPDPKDSESDVDANIGIGGSFPLWHLKEWPGHGGMVAVAQLGVLARFRLEYPTREHAGDDYFVGMPIEWQYDNWSGRFGIGHRSTHLGDELVVTTGADRIEFGGEYFTFVNAYQFGSFRGYVGSTYNFRSYTEGLAPLRARGWKDTFEFHAGVDGGVHRWADGHVGLVGGVDYQTYQRTNWHPIFSFAAGPEWKANGRSMRLVVRHYRGLSAMGEFFLTPEKYWNLEWDVEF